MHVQWI